MLVKKKNNVEVVSLNIENLDIKKFNKEYLVLKIEDIEIIEKLLIYEIKKE